jgi:hypothetical protein
MLILHIGRLYSPSETILIYMHSLEWEWEVELVLRPTVSRPVSLGIGPPFGTLDQILSCSSFV